MRGPSPLYIEERHRALGRDATFSWSRALTHPPRCNRTRHRDHHLVSDFVGPPPWISRRGGRHLGSEVVGAAILDRKCGGRHLGSEVWGPPSWIWRRDVIDPKPAPILLNYFEKHSGRDSLSYIQHPFQAAGASRRTVFRVRKELRETGTLSSPQRLKRGQCKPVDDFDEVVIRNNVQEFFIHRFRP